MKWYGGLTRRSKMLRKDYKEREKILKEKKCMEHFKRWNKWFAWYPVTLDHQTFRNEERKVKVWLQCIWRKAIFTKYDEFSHWLYSDEDTPE